MKRRTFCRLTAVAAGSLLLPAPLLAQKGLTPEEAVRLAEALRAEVDAECPAHHAADWYADHAFSAPPEVASRCVLNQCDEAPGAPALTQNEPNPFTSETTIPFTLAEAGFVDLRIYNEWGQRVATLVKEHLPAGVYEVQWSVPVLARGTYQCVLEAGSVLQAHRMVCIA